MAARLLKGSCGGLAERCWGSLKGLTGAALALAAPRRSHGLLGRSGDGDRLPPAAAGAPAAATSNRLAPLLRLGKAGSNWVTGRRLRRGAVAWVLMLGVGSFAMGSGGGGALCMANFSLSISF